MAFINTRLPSQVEIGAQRRDDEDIEIVTTDAKWEVRNARAEQSLLEFDISFPTATYGTAVNAAVKAMFKAARKSLYAFRFRDFTDFEATAENFGTGDGSTTVFYLRKTWTVDGQTGVRRITRPVTPIKIYKAAVLLTSGYSVDYATGAVTFSPAPAAAAALTWTGEFDIPVRFDTPLGSTALTRSLEHIDTLTLKEVREA